MLSGLGNKSIIKDFIRCGDEAKESKDNSIIILRSVIIGLGTIGSASDGAIEWLIEKLNNDEPDTRMQAYNAIASIIKIFPDFDYRANPSIRARQIKAIRNWCEKNKDKLK